MSVHPSTSFSGDTVACLKNYFETYPDIAALQLSKHTGANLDATVPKWRHRAPSGIYLLRSRYMLDALGYQVEEVLGTPETVRAFARMIAFSGYDDLGSVALELGFKGKHPGDELLAVLNQYVQRNVGPHKEVKMEAMEQSWRTKTEQAIEKLRIAHGFPPTLRAVPELVSTEKPTPSLETPSMTDLLKQARDKITDVADLLQVLSQFPEGADILRLMVDPTKIAELKRFLED